MPVTGFLPPGPPEIIINIPAIVITSPAKGTAIKYTIKLNNAMANTPTCSKVHAHTKELSGFVALPQGTRPFDPPHDSSQTDPCMHA